VRLILDTNIVVSGLLWGGIPRRILDLGKDNQILLFTSSVLLDELANVLERDKFATLLASQDVTPTFLMQRYGMLVNLVEPQPIERTVPSDADDDAVIATALAAHADIIATGDSDLLTLHPYQRVQILNAADALQFILGKVQTDSG